MEGDAFPAAQDIGSPESGANGLAAFVGVRPRLFGIAFRILGSAAEAEDVVQDVWLRWQAIDRSAVLNAPAYLARATTRLAINDARSARSRHETYVGTWLPEPVDTGPSPQLEAERAEALEHAVLLLLETLSPAERAAYVLREAFNYRYRQIAGILRLGEAHIRQLVSRARKHVADRRRAPVRSSERPRLLDAFIAAAERGECDALEEQLRGSIGPLRQAAKLYVSAKSRQGDPVVVSRSCLSGSAVGRRSVRRRTTASAPSGRRPTTP
jgi:RNA polymerase sigma factor (sigma-70 family)